MARSRVTLADVAARAGTSPATASRVLHGGAGVREQLAARVRAVAADLGYSVNRRARSLRRGRDEAVGLAVEDFTIPFFGRIVAAVEAEAHERGYAVLITCAGSGRSAEAAVASLLDHGVAGLVVASGTSGAPQGFLDDLAPELPVVQVDVAGPSAASDSVGIDNAGAGRVVTEHLLARGHERVLFVGSGERATTVVLRRDGYAAAMRSAGLAPRTAWLGYVPAATGALAARALAEAPDVTAVLSGVARTTMGLLSAVRAAGRSDLAVAAIDDLAGADALSPGLTVLDQDAEAIGTTGARLLFDRIDGHDGPPRHVEVGLRLIERGSGERRPPRAGAGRARTATAVTATATAVAAAAQPTPFPPPHPAPVPG